MAHPVNRKKVCLICFRKCNSHLESANPVVLERINQFVIPNFDLSDPKLPIGFCETCRLHLKDIATKDAKPFDLTNLQKYLEKQRDSTPKETDCICDVCKIATAFGGVAAKLRQGW